METQTEGKKMRQREKTGQREKKEKFKEKKYRERLKDKRLHMCCPVGKDCVCYFVYPPLL